MGLILRMIVSTVLIGLIVYRIDWASFAGTLRNTHLGYLTLSLAVSPALIVLSAWKWKVLLRVSRDHLGLGHLSRLYLVGYFFNNFLPTNVGGDVARSIVLGRSTGRLAVATASVFVERFTGLIMLAFIAIAGAFVGDEALWTPEVRIAVAVMAGGVLAVGWLVVDTRLTVRVGRVLRLPLLGKVARLQRAVREYEGHPVILLHAFVLSVAFYLLAAFNIQWSVQAFNHWIGYWEAFWVMPIVLLVSLVPISVGGIGVAEWAYIFGLGALGIPEDAALSVALLLRAKIIALSLVGGLSFGFSSRGLQRGGDAPMVGGSG